MIPASLFFNTIKSHIKETGRPVKLGNIHFSVDEDSLNYDIPVSQWDVASLVKDIMGNSQLSGAFDDLARMFL